MQVSGIIAQHWWKWSFVPARLFCRRLRLKLKLCTEGAPGSVSSKAQIQEYPEERFDVVDGIVDRVASISEIRPRCALEGIRTVGEDFIAREGNRALSERTQYAERTLRNKEPDNINSGTRRTFHHAFADPQRRKILWCKLRPSDLCLRWNVLARDLPLSCAIV